MNNQLKALFCALMLMAFGANSFIYAVNGGGNVIPLLPRDNNGHHDQTGENNGHPRSPQLLPIVTFDNSTATLVFEATAGMVFTYEIVDANDDVIATDIVNLAYGQSQSVILTDLEEGVYTIIIYINGCEYEGEFEK
ncbi:MAG: hypothetical protein J6W75_10295 [Bacteroidaceae bacterium]|nr:hypothetical protein [Bacteroidaceae bacterium]